MKIEDVKKNLNKMIIYKGLPNVYKLTACIIRKNEKGYFYQVEISDMKCGKSISICKLEDIEMEGET